MIAGAAAAQAAAAKARTPALKAGSLAVRRMAMRQVSSALSRRASAAGSGFAPETPGAVWIPANTAIVPAVRRFASAAPKAKPRAKRAAAGVKKPETVGSFISKNWAYGVMGSILAGAGAFAFNAYQEGTDPVQALKDTIDDLFDNAEVLQDPDPEQFSIQMLQMSGNPIQHIPMVAQDGEKIAPNVAVVLTMEGTMVKRVHDRKYGFRHIKRPAVAPLIKSLQGMDVSSFFWVKKASDQSLGDPKCIVYQMLKAEKLVRTAQEMSACVFSRSHMYTVGGKPQIRISPLPRFTPNILLVDNERWNYDAQPDNTLLVPEFTDEEKDDGSALMVVLAFMKLFRHLWKKQEVRTVQDTMRWLKSRHPEIAVNPHSMGDFIREEAADLLEAEKRLQTESVGRVLKDIHAGSATLRGARAVTAHSSTYERVHRDSAVSDRLKRIKERQRAMMAKHQADMAEEAKGPLTG